jgi:O-antigen/teichoic acid export membrane protein
MILFIFGRLGQIVLALAGMRIATTILSPEEMGRMTLILTVTSIFSLFLISPTGIFITRRLHAWFDSGKLRLYFRLHLLFLLIIAIFSGFAIWILGTHGLLVIDVQLKWLIILVCSSLVLTTFGQTTIPSLNILGFRNWFIWLTLFTGATSLVASILLTAYFGREAGLWIAGVIIGQAIGGSIGWIALMGNAKLKQSPKESYLNLTKLVPTYLAFLWPLTITLGLAWTQNQWYRFVFEESLGIYALGLFVAGFGISAGIIGALESAITAYLMPNMYKKINEADSEDWYKTWSEYAGLVYSIVFLFVVYIACLAPQLTQVLVGPMYQSAAIYVGWGAAVELLRVSAGIIALVAQAKMKTRLLLWPALIGAATSVIAILYLMPIYREWGVVIGLILAGLAVSLSSSYLMLDRKKIRINMQSTLKLLMISSLLWLAITMLKNLQFSSNPVISSTITVACSTGVLLTIMYFVLFKRVRQFAA